MDPTADFCHIKFPRHRFKIPHTSYSGFDDQHVFKSFQICTIGKSTLLSIIAGLLSPEEGEVLYRGLSSKDYCADSALKIGYMLQRDHLFEWRTVYQNVTLGLELTHSLTEENKGYILKLLEDYGLYGFKDKKPSELSGGMRQRAALIRTMAIHPDLLLLDEPFSALDFQTRLSVSADIANIIRQTGKTALLITHDLSEAITLADRVIVLSRRPAGVKCEMTIHYDIGREDPLAVRGTAAYQTYFNQLWEVLTDDKTTA
ncbi:MAG: ATP-binding cassette domain-containing protein [Lachnospiraceae bacterium]|nr:ATP-binding cassette domain-containing protein [Lachnospiraceae bacterium]